MKKSLTINKVKTLDAHKLRLTWSNGITAVVDLTDAIARTRSLAALEDTALFGKARLGEWGHSVHWTDDLELGADALWRRTLQAIGRGDVAEFVDWRLRHGLSLSRAAPAFRAGWWRTTKAESTKYRRRCCWLAGDGKRGGKRLEYSDIGSARLMICISCISRKDG